MKFFLKYYFIVGLLLFPYLLHSQINNAQVFIEGDKIIITYDYYLQNKSIDDVIVTYTTGDGTEIKEATQVTGDIHNITPGRGKRIVWNPLNEMSLFSAENLVIYLKGVRNNAKQSDCDNSMSLANRFFSDKDYESAIFYYNEILNCSTCNCNPDDIAFAKEQLLISKKKLKITSAKDKYQISYLFDMASAKGGKNMHGISAFLLRNKSIGYYASFRSDNKFYSPQGYIYYYTKRLKEDDLISPLNNTHISSWLFSTGITHKLITSDFLSAYLYGGIGFGTNSIAGEYNITESGYNYNYRINDGLQKMYYSPELGAIANIYDYFFFTAGLKYPVSITTHKDIMLKGLSAMFGLGIKLKSIEQNSYKHTNTYIAYTIDLPEKPGPDKLQSINIIGISAGTVSYNKLGRYFSVRINPLLFKTKTETELTDNSIYKGVYDNANAFATVGLTWMSFYGGVGASYQKEYKIYYEGKNEIWKSQSEKTGFCTEFGANLRLFDRLLLRGGVTFPNFDLRIKKGEVKMGSDKMFLTLGIGYVFPTN